ncbi:GNAT family N-acetyltransferase [Pseudomonas sp. SZMC_28357]|uniref:GNAT family N-acetyltransferase n=1 Tax=Pseudomonas sp. SZMC_28357 TaxID=3074380 RepID=UPI0028729170|nr:GNAT family N-acetyltransferase [Pseudomonas sp. SZMC_28357]MDR9753649.1 GNAT family N-acetyltransferase [Pseudomonas sp. SZMC_28357]
MNPVTLKAFKPQDADAVSQLFSEVYGPRYPQPDVYLPIMVGQQNTRRQWYSLLAWDAGRLVGHAALCRSAQDRHQAELALLLVHPQAQGQCIATRLGRELVRRAPRLHLHTLSIKQVTSHPYTQRLARGIGFHNCGVLPDYVASPFGQSPQETMIIGCQMVAGHRRPLPPLAWPADSRELMEPLTLRFGTQSNWPRISPAAMTTLYQQERIELVIQRLDKRILRQLDRLPAHWLVSLKLGLGLSFAQDMQRLSALGFRFSGIMPAPGPEGWLALFHRGVKPRALAIDCSHMQRLAAAMG